MNFKSTRPCVICGESRDGMVTLHHIYSQKAFPEFKNSNWNLISYCSKHHNEAHSRGDATMYESYHSVRDWMTKNNWILFNNKLIHED